MAKIKRKNPADHRDSSTSLTTVEMFFIKNNRQMAIKEIAHQLGKPVKLVQAYADTVINEIEAKSKKDLPRGRKLLQRAHGTVGMTEGASMSADDSRGAGNPKLVAIEMALRAGRNEEARQLREEYDAEIEAKRKEKVRNKYNQIVHYIIPPDVD